MDTWSHTVIYLFKISLSGEINLGDSGKKKPEIICSHKGRLLKAGERFKTLETPSDIYPETGEKKSGVIWNNNNGRQLWSGIRFKTRKTPADNHLSVKKFPLIYERLVEKV